MLRQLSFGGDIGGDSEHHLSCLNAAPLCSTKQGQVAVPTMTTEPQILQFLTVE